MALNQKRPNADHAKTAFDLAAQPYVWGTVRIYPTAHGAADIAHDIETATGKFSMYGPAGYFETRTTPVEDGTLLEARYTGGISKPRRPAVTPTSTDLMWADAISGLAPATGPNGTSMTDRILPHDPYITAVVDALAAAGMEPSSAETSDDEINRYDGGPDAGCRTQLQALLTWDGDAIGLNPDVYEDGFVLLWEHPAEQWQWAPRKTHGELAHEPEFLVALPRWADPAVVVIVVRYLLTGAQAPTSVGPLWPGHGQAQAAADAWDVSE